MAQPPAGPPQPYQPGAGGPQDGGYGGGPQYGTPPAPQTGQHPGYGSAGPLGPGSPGGPHGQGVPGGSFGPGSPGGPGAPGGPAGPGGPGSPSGPGGMPPGGGPTDRGDTPYLGLFDGASRHGILGQKRIRHPWEMPLLIAGIVMTTFSYIAWVVLVLWTIVRLFTGGIEAAAAVWAWTGFLPFFIQPFFIQLIVILPAAPVLFWWIRAMEYARLRASAVRMSPTQFPEGYRMVVEAAAQFNLRKVPDAYVVSGGGMVNAFAVGHGFRRFVAVYSDLFEVGGQSRDPEALRFVIAHEVGHLAAGHVSYFRLIFSNVIRMLPILGPALSRSQEYTADNFGYANSAGGALGVMGVLSGGKYLNAEVNAHELADRAATDPSFFVHWANLTSSHPVITWRAHALRDRSKPGALWIRPSGAMFRSPLPPGSALSSSFPTPEAALAMLDAADAARPAGAAGQFGRFPGADYSARPSIREIQGAVPQISDRTAYVIPPGPYRDDARGVLSGAGMSPFATPPQQPPRQG